MIHVVGTTDQLETTERHCYFGKIESKRSSYACCVLDGLRELTLNIVGDLFRIIVETRPTMRLDGLRAIRGLRKVDINGRIDQDCARSLEEAMESPA